MLLLHHYRVIIRGALLGLFVLLCLLTSTPHAQLRSGGVGAGVNEFNVLDYGAVCDGSHDDTAGIQAAAIAADATSGTVVFPGHYCNTTSTITFGNDTVGPAGGYSAIGVRGVSEYASGFHYVGANHNATAVRIAHMSAFTWSHVAIFGYTGDIGTGKTSVGLVIDGPTVGGNPGGTYNTTITFDHVSFSGFHIGLQISGDNGEASEINCVMCAFSFNDIGFESFGFNALNFWFRNVLLGNNLIGIKALDGMHFVGGATSADEVDFDVSQAFGPVVIEHVRAELSKVSAPSSQFVSGINFAPVILRHNMIAGQSETYATMTLALNGPLIMEQNVIYGSIHITGIGPNGTLVMRQNAVGNDDQRATGFPVIFDNSIGAYDSMAPMELRSNREYVIASPGRDVFYQDFEGVFQNKTPVPSRVMPLTLNDPTAIGAAYPFTRSVGLGALIGKNLRDRITFATSATAAFTFQRTASVTVTGPNNITFSANVITPADIGKMIVLPAATAACGGGISTDVTAHINTVTSTTAATLLLPGHWYNSLYCAPASVNGTYTATIGENEPDANYFVTLGCNANETFAVSAKATTGFTLTSSNATSTAVCDVMVMR